MEFEKIYNETYIQAHTEFENYIKEFLTTEENSIYFFNENYNKIRKIHEDEYQKNKFNKIDFYSELYIEFERNRQKIKNDTINKTFKLKVLPLFEKKKEQITYSFERLIQEIATYNARNEAFRIFSNNYKLFENIFESEDYSRFEIKEYDQVLEDTEIYIYYDKIVHPQKYISISKEIQNLKLPVLKNDFSVLESISPDVNSLNKSDFEIELGLKISILEENEKLLILHSLYEVIKNYSYENKNINLAEFLRTILICQGLSDTNIFKENYTTKFYSTVNKGLDYYTNTKNKKDLINSTLKKIVDLKIPEIEKYIKDLR